MNDKFAEMYLKIVKAKGYEQKGNSNAALKEYLDVIENYNPNDDLVFKRACDILMKKNELEESKKIAVLALKKIKDEELSGKADFFYKLIEKIDKKIEEEKQKEIELKKAQKKVKKKNKKSSKTKKKAEKKLKSDKNEANESINIKFRFLENKVELVFIIIAILFFLVISLPDKVFKLMFLSFGVLSLVFLFEIIYSIKEKISPKLNSIFFIFFLILSLVSVYNMPPSNWNQFFEVTIVNQVQDKENSDVDQLKPAGKLDKSKEKINHKIDETDLKNLRDTLDKEMGLNSYKIAIKGDKIILDIKLKPTAKAEEGKAIAINVLNNLALLKGTEGKGDNDLGGLFKEYSVNINIYNSNNKKLKSGSAKKGDKIIRWR